MSIKIIAKNLNVSGLEKNFKKEFDSINTDLIANEILSIICQEIKIDKSNLSLVYRGETLHKNKKISEYISNPDLACIYITEQQEFNFQKDSVQKSDITSLVNHLISLFRKKIRRNLLEKLLLDPTKLQEILAELTELKNDPFSSNFVRNYDLLKLLCDGKKAEEIINVHPNVYFGAKILVNYIRDLSKKIPPDENFIPKGSYTIDEMSEDEEPQQQFAMAQPRPSNHPAVSQDYLSAVLSLLNQQQRPQQQTQTPQPATSTQQPIQQGAQSQYPVMDRNYFENLMQQITNQVPPASSQAQSVQQPSASTLSDVDLATKLEQMHELGFLDDELNIRALQIANGNVEAAISFLIESGGV